MEVALRVGNLVDHPAAREGEMTARAWQLVLFTPVLSTAILCAADFSSYRGFAFGADVATVAKRAGLKPEDAKVIHHRPAMIQEMEWQLHYPVLVEPSRPDPVKSAVLCFFEGKLYRIAVTYDRYRIEGMSVEDMIDAISLTYGAALKPETEIRFHSYYADVAKVLARWEDAVYAYDLIRTGDQSNFALVLYSKEAEISARSAMVAASRLDARDAPRREREQERKRLEAGRLALEKTRSANKPNFRP